MNKSGRHPIALLALSAFVGWLALAAAWACDVFLWPHGPNFATPVGPLGAFLIFGGFFSFFYLVDFVLLAVTFYIFFRHRIVIPWLRGLCGATLFAFSVPLWSVACRSSATHDLPLGAVLAAIAGFVSFFTLGSMRSTTNAA